MRKVINDLNYRGQTVYEETSADRRSISWFSREVRPLPNGTWKFLRWIPLKTLTLDRRWPVQKQRAARAKALKNLARKLRKQ